MKIGTKFRQEPDRYGPATISPEANLIFMPPLEALSCILFTKVALAASF